jgi:hypothetical protein
MEIIKANGIYPPKLPGESRMAYSAFQKFIASGDALRPQAMVFRGKARVRRCGDDPAGTARMEAGTGGDESTAVVLQQHSPMRSGLWRTGRGGRSGCWDWLGSLSGWEPELGDEHHGGGR